MTGLPDLLRRMPYIIYGAAAVVFVWNLANQWFGMVDLGMYGTPGMESVAAFQKSVALYGAFVEAIYLVASGAMIHVLIKIHDKMKATAE
ncbi:hypothetical protein [Pontixanthobacter luteolus]|uniref:hypothetical protein n=1 Tax=Pontixanthobacter luteolus TaxID=295089 RepID=UPI002304A94A|nr:hypothetical protein [Pontixanthobacter luteolus]